MTLCHNEKRGVNMPKDTFLKLNPEKRERIESALINEFSKRTFEEASISNIILEAKIPRGSFYQYFEDKEDAMIYIMKKFAIMEHEKVYNFLVEANGDIFETSIKLFDDMLEKAFQSENSKIIKNILQEFRKRNINIFCNNFGIKYKNRIEEKIDKEKLQIENEEDLAHMLKILTTLMRTESIEVISNRIPYEEGKKEFLKELEILKKGMIK